MGVEILWAWIEYPGCLADFALVLQVLLSVSDHLPYPNFLALQFWTDWRKAEHWLVMLSHSYCSRTIRYLLLSVCPNTCHLSDSALHVRPFACSLPSQTHFCKNREESGELCIQDVFRRTVQCGPITLQYFVTWHITILDLSSNSSFENEKTRKEA